MLPLYTRCLQPADYGVLELAELLVMMAGISFGILEIQTAVTRLYHDQTDEAGRDAILSTGVAATVSISLAVAAAGVAAARPLSFLIFGSERFAALLRVCFAAMVFGNLADSGLACLRVRQQPLRFVLFSLGHLGVALTLNVYLIGFAGLGLWGFAWSKLAAGIAGAAALALSVGRTIRWRFDWRAARGMVRFGGPLVGASVSIFLIHFADRFFLVRYANLEQVGLYALAYKFGFLVAFLVGEPFASKWDVSFYAYAREPDWPWQFARVARYLALALGLAVVGISLFAGQALALVSAPAYRSAADLVPALAFGYAARQMGDLFRNILFLKRRVVVCGAVAAGCAVLNLTLNACLIPQFGAPGAAWATALTWIVYLAAYWRLARRQDASLYPPAALLVMAALAAAATLAGRLVENLPEVSHWAADAALAAAFGAAALALCFPASERARLRALLAEGRNRLCAMSSSLL